MIDHIVFVVPRRLAQAVAWFAGLTQGRSQCVAAAMRGWAL